MWHWSLNWDEITPRIVIGSCPMTPSDIDRIHRKARTSALLSLQHEECLAAFRIDYPAQRRYGERLGLTMARCPIRDFDPPDMRRRLPTATRRLTALIAQGHRVYVHCTAGIGRAPLTVLAYLTFVEGRSLEQASALLARERRCAAPNWEAYHGCRDDLIEQFREQIARCAFELYERGVNADALEDWRQAEAEVIRAALHPA